MLAASFDVRLSVTMHPEESVLMPIHNQEMFPLIGHHGPPESVSAQPKCSEQRVIEIILVDSYITKRE